MTDGGAAFLGWLALASPARRQRAGAGAPRPRDEAFKMVDAYIVSNLQESLGLTRRAVREASLPLVKRLQTRPARAARQRRGRALSELRRVLEAGGRDRARAWRSCCAR